jgi:hypothetical protein
MKIAIGIIGIGISIFVMLQAMAIAGLGGLAEEEAMQQAGSVGVLVAFLVFVASAFTFGLPKVAGVIFFVAALLGFMVSSDFPDMGVWGGVALVLGVLAFIAGRKTANTIKA